MTTCECFASFEIEDIFNYKEDIKYSLFTNFILSIKLNIFCEKVVEEK